jgi:8-oxo-dGTP pyrophosphatase MutT (NUDIX family)
MMKPWKVHNSAIAFDNPWMKIRQDSVELPNGTILDDYFVWLEGDVALVVPVTTEGDFILVRQYKHGVGRIVIEFPAGMVDPGERPEDAAHRELAEETGYTSSSLSLIATLVNSPTKVIGQHYVYLAESAEQTTQPEQSDAELVETLSFSKDELLHAIYTGEIWVTGTISAAFLAFHALDMRNATYR